MASKLRVLLITSPAHRLPPAGYGGTERCVWALAKGLLARGHEVSLMAGPAAKAPCPVIRYQQGLHGHSFLTRAFRKLAFFAKLASLLPRFDLVHSHHRGDYLLPAFKTRLPTVLNFHGPVDVSQIQPTFKSSSGKAQFVGISKNQIRQVSHLGSWTVIYHGIDVDGLSTPVVPEGGYLMYLGRIWKPKGLHTAIAVAKSTNSRLVIAGNVVNHPDELSLPYYEREIAPFIDGKQIIHVGEVDDAEKTRLLRGAKALLMPIEWEEPFGLVMIEALACSTPVIGFRRGSVPEVITDGVDGFICDSLEEMIVATTHVSEIDRGACRKTAETRFSTDVMVSEYEKLYARIAS